MERRKGKEIIVCLTMLLLVVSNCRWFADVGIESYFEYGAYFLMLCGVGVCFLRAKRSPRILIENIIVFLLVSVLFSVGIAAQGMAVLDRLRLIVTMLVLSATAILAEDYFDSLRVIRAAGYGILAGLVVTTALTFAVGELPIEKVYEGLVPYGFTGGVQYKNYFAALVLGSFMSLSFHHRYGEKNKADTVILILDAILILVSCARGTYIFFVLFLVAFYADVWFAYIKRTHVYCACAKYWGSRTKKQRRLLLATIILAVFLVAVAGFVVLINVSENYALRFRGVKNYLNYVKGDWFHIVFGNAKMAWSNPGEDYVTTIRLIVGWDGTYEMGFINTFIKNGVLGLVGFVLLFAHVIRRTARSTNHGCRVMNTAVLCVLLTSALVESFVCNIHAIFGVYCYLLLAGVNGISSRTQETEAVFPHTLLRRNNKV